MMSGVLLDALLVVMEPHIKKKTTRFLDPINLVLCYCFPKVLGAGETKVKRFVRCHFGY